MSIALQVRFAWLLTAGSLSAKMGSQLSSARPETAPLTRFRALANVPLGSKFKSSKYY
jgi:hypothetical protein